jgi:hypothetical protein
LSEETLLESIEELAHDLWSESTAQALAHAYASEYWGRNYLILGVTITTISAAISASIFVSYSSLAFLAGILSLILVITSSMSTFLNPDQKTNAHFKAKNLYEGLADRAAMLYFVDFKLKKINQEQGYETYYQLIKERDRARKVSPRVPMKYMRRACKECLIMEKEGTPLADL